MLSARNKTTTVQVSFACCKSDMARTVSQQQEPQQTVCLALHRPTTTNSALYVSTHPARTHHYSFTEKQAASHLHPHLFSNEKLRDPEATKAKQRCPLTLSLHLSLFISPTIVTNHSVGEVPTSTVMPSSGSFLSFWSSFFTLRSATLAVMIVELSSCTLSVLLPIRKNQTRGVAIDEPRDFHKDARIQLLYVLPELLVETPCIGQLYAGGCARLDLSW